MDHLEQERRQWQEYWQSNVAMKLDISTQVTKDLLEISLEQLRMPYSKTLISKSLARSQFV